VPGSSITLGIQNIVFMSGPLGGFNDDDGAAIKLNMKFDPVDIEVYTAKLGEGNSPGLIGGPNSNADDTDMYVARVGVNITKDMRATLEGMLINDNSLAGSNLGDTFWVGATFGANFGVVKLDAAGIYGQRQLGRAATAGPGDPFQESGFGGYVTAQVPVGPLNVFGVIWYTTGDSTVGPAGCSGAGSNAGCGAQNRTLTQDSDKLPVPEAQAGWFGGGGPFIAEWLFGNSTIGAPSVGQVQYADPTGTYGIGASATYALTPALSVGGGAAYVAAEDAAGPYGDWLFEFDAGATYRFNPNLVFNLFGGVMSPDQGDLAWAVTFRTQYSF
jgi:hypothetical protein